MAEHGGGEEAETEAGGGSAAASNAAAVGVALGGTRAGKLAPEAAAYLASQKQLVDVQLEHLHEERELQHRHMRLKFFGDRLKVTLQLLTVGVGTALVLAIAALAWNAHQQRGLVIEAFSVPPDLAARGLTGKVVASKLLDDIAAMQKASDGSVRQASTYANNWAGDIKVEIPETGVSIGELRNLLVEWLGHQTSIDGEVYRSPAGLVVAARSGGEPAKDHAGAEADLDALIQSAAEDIYKSAQPYRYGLFLRTAGRIAEADDQAGQIVASGPEGEKPWALVSLAHAAPTNAQGIALYRQAISLNPNFVLAIGNLAAVLYRSGREEEALKVGHDDERAMESPGHGGISEAAYAVQRYINPEVVAARTGDIRAARDLLSRAVAAQSDGFRIGGLANTRAGVLTSSHEPTAAKAQLSPGDDASLTLAVNRPGGPRLGNAGLVRANTAIAREMEDWPGVYAQASALAAVVGDPANLVDPSMSETVATIMWPDMAEALAHMGRLDEARALIEKTPADCYRCVRMRGTIAALAGDAPGADRWFAEAVRQGPSLAFAQTDWAHALLARGDVAGAIAKLVAANRKSPHFPDALELWGEALLARGDTNGAVAKFAEADKYAPRWGRNHLKWGEALAKAGKAAEAKAQFTAAAGMDLTVAEKAELAGVKS